ncbi:MAG: bifunctional sugar phosphate isomerase/epimerase/4-hydroxyphenylpyruvate dioxygenase family protein [Candidatus Puniceispirillaceae bacterium]
MNHAPGKLKTCIATVSIAGDFREKLAAISRAGFTGIEIFEQDFLAYDGAAVDVGWLVGDYGLEIMLFQPFRDFEGLPEPYRSRAFDRAERKFDLMNSMGADLVLICSNLSAHALGGIDRAADDLAELGERAKARGLRIGFEALAWGRHINDHRDAWEVVRRADHSHVGLILDSFHTLSRKIDPDTIRAIPGDKIFFVQLADAPLIDMDLFYWSRHFRNMPGEGDLPVVDFMRAVSSTGYAGPLSLEVFNDQFRGGSPVEIARDGHRSLLGLMDDVRRSEPDIRLPVPDMPPRAQCAGVEFIEFTTSEEEAADLADFLAVMGFVHVGNHVSKQVMHWRQNEINILINTEEFGFAHSAYQTHGTSVCDIAFRVDDATSTIERARLLGAEIVTTPAGRGELAIPAIKGVGGGILRFVDDASGLTNWSNVDFRPVEAASTETGVGLEKIDHLAQTMKYEDMLTWTLFYTSILDAGKVSMVDVVDPGGLVRSRAIQNVSGDLRITLNGAENLNTLAGQFIDRTFGAAVQHLAFSCTDIFATAEALAVRGFEALEISPNYYEDLGARFGLQDAFLARLQQSKILYDEDADGRYFQLYSRRRTSEVFFEIVQRDRDYDGYGAANAPFRVSAQKRVL